MGNVVNRVFDSSGPEGKVRGTPQQIIDKYQQLHRDSQLSGDRVSAENFAQHAEHYARMLGEALREQEARREAQEAQQQARQQQNQQQNQQNNRRDEQRDGDAQPDRGKPQESDAPQDLQNAEQPDVIDLSADDSNKDSGLVETAESAPKPPRKPRAPRARKPKPEAKEPEANAPDAPAADGPGIDETPAAE